MMNSAFHGLAKSLNHYNSSRTSIDPCALCRSVAIFTAFHDSEISVVFFYNVAQHTMHRGQNWVFNILTKGSILSVRF